MELFENPEGKEIKSDVTTLLDEPVEKVDSSGPAAEVDKSDFIIDNFEPTDEQKHKTQLAEEKETIKDNPDPAKKDLPAANATTETKAAPDKKTEIMLRTAKPEIAILFYNVILTRVGGIIKPDRPREYWELTKQDREDLSFLLGETYKEEGWTGIPSKWLFLGAILLMTGAKVYGANKPYDPKKGVIEEKNADGKQEEKKEEPKNNSYQEIYARERARYEADKGMGNMNELLEEVRKENKLLKEVLDKGSKNNGSYVPFQEVIVNTDLEKKRHFKGWDLEEVSFTRNGAIIDKKKAGHKGYTDKGVKMGNPTTEERELFRAWEEYQAAKEKTAA